MFKDSIQGLDKVFRTDIEAPKVVLVTGPPGSMKSFCYSLMSTYLESKKHGERFTVFTLDSLGALYSLIEDSAGMRRMFYFFKNLRDLGLTSFIVMERAPNA